MRKLIAIVLLLPICFVYTQGSYAVCVENPADVWVCNTNPPNPDLQGVQDTTATPKNVTVLPGAGIDTFTPGGGDNAIETGDGDDTIMATESTLVGGSDVIEADAGDDDIKIVRSIVSSPEGNCIRGADGMDHIEVIDSELTCFADAIEGNNQEDNIKVSGSILTSTKNDVIEAGAQDDVVTIADSVLSPDSDTAIIMGQDNDTVNLGTGAEVNGIIDCGSGFDTLTFMMDVPLGQLNRLSGEILLLDPSDDSIVINGLTYTWEDCELLVNELVGVRITRPIPTLSEWGLIAMAGILGIIGLFAIRKRKALC